LTEQPLWRLQKGRTPHQLAGLLSSYAYAELLAPPRHFFHGVVGPAPGGKSDTIRISL